MLMPPFTSYTRLADSCDKVVVLSVSRPFCFGQATSTRDMADILALSSLLNECATDEAPHEQGK
eukprot:4584-Eustigmatos_ZCMA.PRE.1